MKTLTALSKPIEAQLLVARLEGSGIRAFIRDEYTITNDWFYSNALGGLRVEVADEDYAKACDVLKQEPAGEEGG
jgi:hypothetical protein